MTSGFPSILCVDDDAEAVERLQEHFTLQGFIVLTAINGVEACLQVKRWAPSAVILDLFIPRLGGIAALGRIRAIAPGIPVVLTTDRANALDMISEAGLNVAGAFAKPLDLEAISDALGRVGVRPPAELAANTHMRHTRPRVLLVDDETEFRETVAAHLGGQGYEARQAGNGEDALALLEEFAPHIVLLDLMMAGFGGLEALRNIKALFPSTCVIIVTATEDLDAARGALACGAADYVTKPFPLQYLDAVLDVHLPLDLASRPPHPSASEPADHSLAD